MQDLFEQVKWSPVRTKVEKRPASCVWEPRWQKPSPNLLRIEQFVKLWIAHHLVEKRVARAPVYNDDRVAKKNGWGREQEGGGSIAVLSRRRKNGWTLTLAQTPG